MSPVWPYTLIRILSLVAFVASLAFLLHTRDYAALVSCLVTGTALLRAVLLPIRAV